MKISNARKGWFGLTLQMALGLSLTVAVQAQTGVLPVQASEAATDQSSYAARVLNRRGVHEVDPNIYVYNAEFAKRFQMPLEWVSDELKGADAVAFRVVPGYKTCGWGGNPQACREDEVRCEMDLYFDHQRNPLPWDERMKSSDQNYYRASAWFLASPANRFARPRTNLLGGPPLPREPFTDSQNGKELGWQDYMKGNSVGGWIGTLGYDRELFQGVSLVTLSAVCGQAPLELWLASSSIYRDDIDKSSALSKRIVLPERWRSRVEKDLQSSEQRSKAFYKEQGEKALKALKEAPAPNKVIVPLQ
jgi:hypothetical protein